MPDMALWLTHLSSTLKAANQLAYLWHVGDGRMEFLGDAPRVLGCDDEYLPQRSDDFVMLINPQDIPARQIVLADVLEQSRSGDAKNFTLNYRIKNNDGNFTPVIETGSVVTNAKTGAQTVHSLLRIDAESIARDISLFEATKHEPKNVSFGLMANMGRQGLEAQLEKLLGLTNDQPSRGFLLAVGVDQLSLINHTYGSHIADEVIIRTGKRLEALAGTRAYVTRISGDLFGVLIKDGAAHEMNGIANSILRVFYHQPFDFDGQAIPVMVSIGGVEINQGTTKASTLLAQAELALREAKNRGRGCFVVHDETISSRTDGFADVLAIGDKFLKSFRDRRIKMAFQPIINAKTQDVTFYECLIRMVGEDGKIVPAGMFIPAIERMGLTRLADGFCTREAIAELKNYDDLRLSINVSNHTLTDPQWLKDISESLGSDAQVARRLIVEITESAAMFDINQTMKVIKTLQEMGCQIALDDFGAGQTAFTQLRDLSLNIVKIDKSFVRNIHQDDNMLFIRALQSIAEGMNLETVGEGAETLAEAKILADGGINHIQGYAYGMPSLERLWLPQNHLARKI
jgi:diguanylate cyclase (GGDEF)-like protein